MDITPLIRSDQKVIQSYKSGVFRISGVVYDHPVFISPLEVLPWDVDSNAGVESLLPKHFDIVLKHEGGVDVVLLGCGKDMALMPTVIDDAFKESDLSVDIMDTGAASRTYNVLMAEGRRVVCLLLPYI